MTAMVLIIGPILFAAMAAQERGPVAARAGGAIVASVIYMGVVAGILMAASGQSG